MRIEEMLGLLILIELIAIGLGFYFVTEPIKKELKGIKEALEKLTNDKNRDKPE